MSPVYFVTIVPGLYPLSPSLSKGGGRLLMKGLRHFKLPFIYKRGKALFDLPLSLSFTSLTGEGKKKPWKGFAFLLFSLKIYLLYIIRRSILYMKEVGCQ
jgi:hypothetical protein